MNVTIKTNDKDIIFPCSKKTLISSILELSGFKLGKPCGGKGKCGKCRVLAFGNLSPLCETEIKTLSETEISNHIRLACLTYVLGDSVIDCTTKSGEIQGLTFGFMPEFIISPLTGEKECFGAAIDIGTTTIAGYLYKFPESRQLKALSLENTQTQFGADVISRIEYALGGGLSRLQSEVKGQINKMIELFGEKPEVFVITGNTTMLHLYAGLDPSGIAVAPFTPRSLFGYWTENVYIPKCISSYVGADITLGILASGMKRDKCSFLVDIGTNGEMAYWSGDSLTCCSTAAGPAFEGAGISCGMPAKEGAINKVYLYDGKIFYTTIGSTPPTGICGSGLIDAVACMLELGVVDETGYLDRDFELGDSGVYIKPADIRAVQLAKSAIRAGIETLADDISSIDKFYIAGGFGNYVSIRSCVKIGLIPKEAESRAIVIGNSAGTGACMVLQSKACLEESEKIAEMAIAVELSESHDFMEKYIKNMSFTEV